MGITCITGLKLRKNDIGICFIKIMVGKDLLQSLLYSVKYGTM